MTTLEHFQAANRARRDIARIKNATEIEAMRHLREQIAIQRLRVRLGWDD